MTKWYFFPIQKKFIQIFGLFFILFIIAAALTYGYDKGSPFIQNFSPEDYKGHIQNFSVIQDNRGLIYFGNANGVLEFDGVYWRMIKISNNSLVRSLAIDKNNRVLVGAVGEFGYLESNSDGIMVYVSLTGLIVEKDREFSNVWDIVVSPDGIFFCTAHKVFRWKNGNIITISGYNIRSGFKINNKLIIHDKEKGIMYLDGIDLRPLPKCKRFTYKTAGSVVILPYDRDQFLIITEKQGCYKYDLDVLSKNHPSVSDRSQKLIYKFKTDVDEFFKQNRIYKGKKIGDSQYAFTTLNGGIVIMDDNGKLKSIINKKSGLLSNTLVGLYIDHNQNLWVTSMRGLSYIILNSPLSQYNESNGVDEIVISIIKFNKDLFLGAVNGTFLHRDQENKLNSNQSFFKPVIGTEQECFDFIVFKNILFGTGRNGIFQIKGNKAVKYRLNSFPYSFGKSKKFPDYFFCGLREGLIAVKVNESQAVKDQNNKDVHLKFISHGQFQNIKEIIRKIVTDQDGNLWLTTRYNGVIFIKFKSRDISDFEIFRYSVSEGLPQGDWNRINIIDNRLLAITQKGIYKAVFPEGNRSDPKKIRFAPVELFGGLIKKNSLEVSLLINDDKSNYWVATKNGMGIINKGSNDSFVWNEIPFKKIIGEVENIFLDNEGIAWISSHKPAIYRYDPSIKKDYKKKYNTYIRKVIIAGKYSIYNGNLKKSISPNRENDLGNIQIESEELPVTKIAYKNNSVSFEFAAAYYEQINDMKYNWFLDGFDNSWKGWNKGVNAIYTNLPIGDYTFIVKARNVFDYESKVAEFKFSISPPWYLTLYAYAGYFLGFCFLFYFVIKLNSKRLVDARLKLENIVDERTAEIENKKAQIQEQAEQLRNQNQELEKLSIVARETDNIVVIADGEGKLEWANEAFTRMYGWSLKECIKARGPNIADASLNPKFCDILNRCINSKKSVTYETLITAQTGEKIWIQSTLTPILNNNGEIKKIIALDTDINELKNAEKLARESEEKYRNLVELADDGIAILQEEKFVYFNPKVAQLLNYKGKELIGLEIYKIIHPNYHESFQNNYKYMKNGENTPKSFETRLLSKNGNEIDVIVNTRDINYNNSSVTMVFFHDISDRKRLEEVRLKSKKLKSIGLLAGGIAHDFNNLLTVILGRINFIKQSNIEQHTLAQINVIEKSALAVSDLVKNFLALSEGDVPIKKNIFIQKTLERIGKNILDGTEIESIFKIANDLWSVYCDLEQIEMVINNILLNSIEAIIENGRIEIMATNVQLEMGQVGELPDGDYVKIIITDNGEGITGENLSKIFDPYFSTRQRVTKKGLGMGLSIAYSIIINHNGYIEVESETGLNTGVIFYLPAAKM